MVYIGFDVYFNFTMMKECQMKKIAILIISLTVFINAQDIHPTIHGNVNIKKLHNSSNSEIPKLIKKMLMDNGGTVESFAKIPDTDGSPSPVGMVITSDGTIIVSSYETHKLFSITSDGSVSVYAGSGNSGIAEGYGELADFISPAGLAIKEDTIYVANQNGNVISKIYPDKYVQVFAGDPESGYTDATGLAARFNRPTYLAMDTNGNLFVTDQMNNRIRKITPAGVVTTFLGDGTAENKNGTGLSARIGFPFGIESDSDNNLYVASWGSVDVLDGGTIRKITPDSVMSTYYDIGEAYALFGGMSFDSKGNLYAPEVSAYHNIYKISPDSSIIKVAGTDAAGTTERGGGAFNTSFANPYSVLVDPNNDRIVYVSDYGSGEIFKLILNDPPVISAIDDVTIKEDESITISLSATDVDDDLITFSVKENTDLNLKQYLNFDGTSNWIETKNASGEEDHPIQYGEFTVSAWAKASSLSSGLMEIVSQGQPGSSFYLGSSNTGDIIRAGDDWEDTGVTFPRDDQWHHYVLSSSSSNAQLYLDGSLAATKGSAIQSPDGGSGLRIGRQYGTASEYFHGSIAEVSIWSSTLSALEVAALYNGGSILSPMRDTLDYSSSGNVTIYYPLNEGEGSTVYGKEYNSSEVFTGEIKGDAEWTKKVNSLVTATISGSTLNLIPDANWHGEANYNISASDGSSASSTSFTLTVTPVQDPPSAFEWISQESDSIYITQDSLNLEELYTLEWSVSEDVDNETIFYILNWQIGTLVSGSFGQSTGTSLTLNNQENAEGAFDVHPYLATLPRLTVYFTAYATDGIDTVKVDGNDRVLFVNRYEYLSTESDLIPTEYALHENFPNPFNPSTTLRFDLPYSSDVNLTIYNMLGQKVKSFDMRGIQAGKHTLRWNATNDLGEKVGTGVYLYQLQTKDFMKTRKMIFMK